MEIRPVQPDESVVARRYQLARLIKFNPIATVVVRHIARYLGITGGFEYADSILAAKSRGKITAVLGIGEMIRNLGKAGDRSAYRPALTIKDVNGEIPRPPWASK